MSARTISSWLVLSFALSSAALAQMPRADIQFNGGSLEAYVGAVRDKLRAAKIVVDGVGNTAVPKVNFTNASIAQALQWYPTTAAARMGGVILQTTRAPNDSGDVFVFTVAQAPVPRPDVEPEILVKDHAIDSIPNRPDWPEALRAAVASKLKARDPNHVTGSVELVAGRPPMLRMRGTRIDIQDGEQTISEMERVQRPNAALPQLQAEVGRLRTQVDSMRVQIADILKRLPPGP